MTIMAKRSKLALKILLAGIFSYISGLTFLINMDDPSFEDKSVKVMSAEEIEDLGFEQIYSSTPASFKMRDGARLASQRFEYNSDLSVIVVHGILTSGYTYNRFAGLIREAAKAEVYTIDLRGHGESDGRRGDVDYIGQYVDDLTNVVQEIRQRKPNGKIILAGHSMGGGISLLYAMQDSAPSIDGYLLFAPLLGDNSPTSLTPNDEPRKQDEPFMKIHLPRIIGLALMNSMGIRNWNDLPVFFFNVPESSPVTEYTFRSSASMSPTDYKKKIVFGQ